jgi:hypothetical protein
MSRIFFTFFLTLFVFSKGISLHAQDLTGIWRGYFITETGDYYKLEFQVEQTASNSVSGVSYSYLDVRFYGKATMTGNFIKPSSSFRIREIKTVEVKSTMGGSTCIMNYKFTYSKSGKEEFLDGTYLGKFENKYSTSAAGTWGDCGGGKVHLRRVTTSDFYIEPFLRNKIKKNDRPVIINQPPIKKDTTKKIVTTPPVTKPVITKPPVTKPENKPITKTTPPPPIAKTDTAKGKVIIPPVTKTIPPVITPTPTVIQNRSNELVKVLTVNDPDVIVKLYDNGEIDGDTISVYLDKKLVLSSKRLTASPLEVKFKMDEDNNEHELTMVAENLGSIPPNTSLMIVEAGEQRYEVRITSTEQKNAVVKFRYLKSK